MGKIVLAIERESYLRYQFHMEDRGSSDGTHFIPIDRCLRSQQAAWLFVHSTGHDVYLLQVFLLLTMASSYGCDYFLETMAAIVVAPPVS